MFHPSNHSFLSFHSKGSFLRSFQNETGPFDRISQAVKELTQGADCAQDYNKPARIPAGIDEMLQLHSFIEMNHRQLRRGAAFPGNQG